MHTKLCVYCNLPFQTRDRRTTVCHNKECRNHWNRDKYLLRTHNCICQTCGAFYIATDKQRRDKCPDCVKITTDKVTKKTFTQIIGCKYCKKPMGQITKHCSKKQVTQINTLICDECRKNNKLNVSKNMQLNNPSYTKALTQEEYDKKQQERLYKQSEEYKQQRKIEVSNLLRQRMIANNPMHNEKIKQKVRETLIDGYVIGKYKKYLGKNHWNYKGTRSISNYLRLCLSDWKKQNLKRTDYSCELCGIRGTYLHIHHKVPFKNIIHMGMEACGITDLQKIDFRDEDFQKLEKWIIDYHNNNDIGIVVCRKCHAIIDSRYFAPKKLYLEEINETN